MENMHTDVRVHGAVKLSKKFVHVKYIALSSSKASSPFKNSSPLKLQAAI